MIEKHASKKCAVKRSGTVREGLNTVFSIASVSHVCPKWDIEYRQAETRPVRSVPVGHLLCKAPSHCSGFRLRLPGDESILLQLSVKPLLRAGFCNGTWTVGQPVGIFPTNDAKSRKYSY